MKINRLVTMLIWGMLISGVVVLLVAAVRNNNSRRCQGMKISISGNDDKLFIDENEIRRVILQFAGSGVAGRPVSEFDLHAIENSLKRDIWVREAKLYFDNNEMFRVSVVQREPVARLFTKSGHSFYIDSGLVMLPLSELFSARVPVFTGFPADQKVLKSRDSVLLRQIRDLSAHINGDPVISAMIEQVDITPMHEFEMIPKLGNQVVLFGDASDADEKFSKMMVFYREMLDKGRMNRYGKISLKYKGQVVATVKGMENVIPDSVSTTQMMEMIAARAERMANDTVSRIVQDNEKNTTDVSIIQQSMERDAPGDVNAPAPAAVEKKPAVIKKPVITRKPEPEKPRTVNKQAAGPVKKENKPLKPAAAPKAPAKPAKPESKKAKTKN